MLTNTFWQSTNQSHRQNTQWNPHFSTVFLNREIETLGHWSQTSWKKQKSLHYPNIYRVKRDESLKFTVVYNNARDKGVFRSNHRKKKGISFWERFEAYPMWKSHCVTRDAAEAHIQESIWTQVTSRSFLCLSHGLETSVFTTPPEDIHRFLLQIVFCTLCSSFSFTALRWELPETLATQRVVSFFSHMSNICAETPRTVIP